MKTIEIFFILIISFIGLTIWFLKFPLYRYGISYIIMFIVSASILIFYKFEISLLKKRNLFYFKFMPNNSFRYNFKRILNNFDNNQNLPSLYFMGRDITYKNKFK